MDDPRGTAIRRARLGAVPASAVDLIFVAFGLAMLAFAPLLRRGEAVFYVGLIPTVIFVVLWLVHSRRRGADRFSAFVAVGVALVSLVLPVGIFFAGPASLLGAGLVVLGLGRSEPREWIPGIALAVLGFYALGAQQMPAFVNGAAEATIAPYLLGGAFGLGALAWWISRKSHRAADV